MPPFWPDNEVSRNDVLDYYWKAERFDREVGELLDLLDKAGTLDQHTGHHDRRQRLAFSAVQSEPLRRRHPAAPGRALAD